MFCLGPYIVSSSDNSDATPELDFTGYAIEFATSTWNTTIPIYRNPRSCSTSGIDLDGLLFHQRFQELDISLWRHHIVSTPVGQFVPLGSFVGALYSEYPDACSITELLRDLRKALTLVQGSPLLQSRHPDWASPLMRDNGFVFTGTWSHGTRLYADFGWIFPQDRAVDAPFGIVAVSSIMFRPAPDGQLRPEIWRTQKIRRFADLLWNFACKVCKGNPLNAISEAGTAGLLAAYEWTPLSKLTSKEARVQRVEFIRKNLHLVEKPKELAAAMKANALYSPATSSSQIVKFLHSLIAEARN